MSSSTTLPFSLHVRAILSGLIIPPLLELISFARLARLLSGKSKYPKKLRSDIDDHSIAAWVRQFLYRLPPPWHYTCLRRTAVLFYLLRRAGRPVELWIGVNHNDVGAIAAHAWLVKDGTPYLESESDPLDRFRVIARFPEATKE